MPGNEPAKWSKLNGRFFLGVGCGCAILVTFFLAIVDQTSSAIVTATLALGLLIFSNLSMMETFKMFGLEAKLRAQIDDAEKLLSHIRLSTQTSSRLALTQLAYMNRIAGLSWKEKQVFLEDIDRNLSSLEVDSNSVRGMKEPLRRCISLDMLQPLAMMIDFRVSHWKDAWDTELRTRKSSLSEEERTALSSKIDKLERRPFAYETALSAHEFYEHRASIPNLASLAGLPVGDIQTLQALTDEICAAVAGIWAEDNLPDAAVEIADRSLQRNYNNKLYEQLFDKK